MLQEPSVFPKLRHTHFDGEKHIIDSIVAAALAALASIAVLVQRHETNTRQHVPADKVDNV